MPESPARRPSSTYAAWIAAAVAAVVAVLLGIAAAQAEDDRRPVRGHGVAAGDGHAHSHMSHGASATDERDYLVEMIAHHREAVAVAAELRRSERPQMRELGRSIVTGQTAEIEQMEAWLEQWYGDTDPSAYEPMMRELDGLAGDDLDRVFLEDMVMHHHMAVMSSQHLLTDADTVHAEVANLARDITTAQTKEIRQMRRWLDEWFGVETTMGMGSTHGM